ncbi:hypothetical protein D9M71_36860 [compost metagenome]
MDAQQRESIAVEIFRRTGIGLDKDDPVFVLAEICKEIFKEDTEFYVEKQQAVLSAIKQIPGAITDAVQVVALAVERAESISGELATAAVEKARAEASGAIADALKVHLNGANDELSEFERRLKSAGDSIRDKKSFRLNMVLGVSLLFCAVSIPLTLLMQKSALDKAQEESAFYLREIAALERSIEQLPPALRERVKQAANR